MECENNIEMLGNIRVEIKEEDISQDGMGLVNQQELTLDLVPLLPIKEETVYDVTDSDEDPLPSQSSRLTSDGVSQDGSGSYTSPIHCNTLHAHDHDQPTISQTNSDIADGIHYVEMTEFGKAFKLQQLSSRPTQTQVGEALSITGRPEYNQNVIHRYKIGVKPSKKRKDRTMFSDEDLKVLNARFEQSKRIPGTEMTALAHQLGYERKVIKIWFQNKRQSLKRSINLAEMNGAVEDPLSSQSRYESDVNPSKKRKLKSFFTARDLEVLSACFKKIPYPSVTDISELAHQLGRERELIRLWFQNKRRNTNVRRNLIEVSAADEDRLSSQSSRYESDQNDVAEFTGKKPSKKPKCRTSFTPQALHVLNACFECKAYVSGKEMTDLALQLGYEREVIQVWFINKRQSLKRSRNLLEEEGADKDPSSSQSSRLENLDIRPENAKKISKPMIEMWMKEAEERYKSGVKPSKKVKPRTFFTAEDLEVLNARYKQNPQPSAAEVTDLAHQLGYERDKIRMWFVNQKKRSPSSCSNQLKVNGAAEDPLSSQSSRYKYGQKHVSEFTGINPSQQKMHRTSFTSRDLEVLNACFEHNSQPSVTQLNYLAHQLGYDVLVIQTWFQNKKRRSNMISRNVPLVNLADEDPS